MSRVSTYEQDLSQLERGARIKSVEAKDLLPHLNDTYCISPGTWVEDPITGEKESIKYWYKTTSALSCPHCYLKLSNATFIKTKKHIILFCDECHTYTWLRVVK